jgi:ATP-dependent Lon protease
VRNLVRKTNNVFNKMALKLVKKEAFNEVIKKEDLKDYLGLPKFFDARLFHTKPPAGVMIGLAYNAYGGSIMYIESIVVSG